MKPLLLILALSCALYADFDVKTYGATGDGKTLDTAAINKAIDAASAAGGGTVRFGAGTFVTGSIHLRSHISLYLDAGATIEASADPKAYDDPEPNQWDKFQDYGHSHFRNSLIWGENLEDISILGPGRIYGKGLVRNAGPNSTMKANKAISLKLCRNVIIRDVTILMGGHFAILATGVDNMTLDNLKIDTNRDGIDVDACRNVRISNCTVNSPADDGIVIKSDYSLGFFRDVENLTIINCQVSGFDAGTLLDGTFKMAVRQAPDREGPTGRIKLGTESSGGFKNVTISNSVFIHCRGLALETVDGGALEDVTISNITMRDITNAPIFLRLGSRMRSPENTPIGVLRRVDISHIVVYDADPRQGSIISGIPGHDIEDVTLSDIRIYYKGGGTKEQAALVLPENENMYPEPRMFGVIPAYGFFIRHVKGIEMRNVQVSYAKEDLRPAFRLEGVKDAEFSHIRAQHAQGVPAFVMKDVEDVSVRQSRGLPDTHVDSAKEKVL